jgi:hypothetical protein
MHVGDKYHLVFGGDLAFGQKGRSSGDDDDDDDDDDDEWMMDDSPCYHLHHPCYSLMESKEPLYCMKHHK